MNRLKYVSICFVVLLVLLTCCNSEDRQPAVAGQFYPGNANELSSALSMFFSKAVKSKQIKDVLAVIVPHAGYVFSGEVAASAFNQLDSNRKYENVFVIGSSHYMAFDGASIYVRGDFITPLGKVKVNKDLGNELIKKHSVFTDRVDAHLREHSLEVQLPFLQYILKKDFKIIPIVIGTQSPEICKRIAEALKPFFNTKNLFVISTDFSHYPKYDDAIKVDKAVADAIISNSSDKFMKTIIEYERKGIYNLQTCVCGWTSVLTLLYITENDSKVRYTHIQYKNSGDVDYYGDKDRVVGYNAICVSIEESKSRTEFNLNEKDKKDLLRIARNTIVEYINNGKIAEIDEGKLSSAVKAKCGTFVTLHKHGQLRGCIGRFDADEPLYKVVQRMAIASATQDFRFSPVTSEEIPELEIEISVLTPMRRISSIDEIQLGKHGIYIKKGNRAGTFLPQVATETGWTKEEFLGHCARDKAGIGWDGWKDAEIYIYEALVFSEKELGIK